MWRRQLFVMSSPVSLRANSPVGLTLSYFAVTSFHVGVRWHFLAAMPFHSAIEPKWSEWTLT